MKKHIYASDHNSNSETNVQDSGNSSGHKSGDNHHHGMISIPEAQPVPNVDLIVHKDSKAGWNLEVKVDNFRLAPENVNQEGDYSEGHALSLYKWRKDYSYLWKLVLYSQTRIRTE